ncbi:putative glucosamine-phosphate N-acetyltransferase transcription regulator GNAT family [Helianthus annuus]|nr:putative glucosamine-phosphate N-acetyltransferase transcription regulator GNAT family [Helianthus annuus]KAJ0531931.1 putative glucosamine-phosphate N-acetyltransferase transcription regulator GNAT family [Helianthus annuus]KAJ0540519.1 putative glucosamine-phosphate N-acetyltransferase transcription regulator GNAT family [Helianthus annuus]KAJ0705661.1 putative glucosamine-phosphate N-acetyltransferase transcription regulator GNAT family [Helianthus annuus]KAJ0885950.1 putative glucosamine
MQSNTTCGDEERYQVRKLEITDKNKCFMELLQQLTVCDSVSDDDVFVEKKFVRNCGKVGHIEDVVVDSSARGLQLGKRVVGFLADHARLTGCYKVILDCSGDNKAFYDKCGFKEKGVHMV